MLRQRAKPSKWWLLLALPPVALVTLWAIASYYDQHFDEEPQPLRTIDTGAYSWTGGIAFWPDNHHVVAGVGQYSGSSDDVPVRVWDVHSGQLQRTLPLSARNTSFVAHSPDGRLMAMGNTFSRDIRFEVWDTETDVNVATSRYDRPRHFSDFDIEALAFALDNNSLITLAKVSVPKVEFVEPPGVRRPPEPPRRVVTNVQHEQIEVWSIKPMRLRYSFKIRDGSGGVGQLAVTQDPKIIALVNSDASGNDVVQFWNLETRRLVRSITPKTGGGMRSRIDGFCFSSDDSILAILLDGDAVFELWNFRQEKLLRTVRAPGRLDTVNFTADGRSIAAGGSTWITTPWQQFQSRGAKRVLGTLCDNGGCEPDSDVVGAVGVREIQTGRLLHWFRTGGGVFSIAFSKDGKTMATRDFNGPIRIWDARKLPPLSAKAG